MTDDNQIRNELYNLYRSMLSMLEDENVMLSENIGRLKAELDAVRDEMRKKDDTIRIMQDRLLTMMAKSGGNSSARTEVNINK